jgi:hypothetical protein
MESMQHMRWVVKTDDRLTSFNGSLYLERRPKLSPNWECRCCHQGKQLYKTTKSPLIGDAKLFAERWYRGIQNRIEAGEPPTESIMLRFLKEPGINLQELATFSGTSPAVLNQYYLSHLTGSCVSERLMAKAIAEFGEATAPEEFTWSTSAGVLKHSVKRPA